MNWNTFCMTVMTLTKTKSSTKLKLRTAIKLNGMKGSEFKKGGW